MQKIYILIAIVLNAIGLHSWADQLDQKFQPVVRELLESGLRMKEVDKLANLSINDPELYKRMVEQDVRIKGELKLELLSNGNSSGRSCVTLGEQ